LGCLHQRRKKEKEWRKKEEPAGCLHIFPHAHPESWTGMTGPVAGHTGQPITAQLSPWPAHARAAAVARAAIDLVARAAVLPFCLRKLNLGSAH
jgi:hypothetical protein